MHRAKARTLFYTAPLRVSSRRPPSQPSRPLEGEGTTRQYKREAPSWKLHRIISPSPAVHAKGAAPINRALAPGS
jgi:hypothetical protein